MIKFKLNKIRKRIYFKPKPSIFDMFTFNEFIQSSINKQLFGFYRTQKYTKIINLKMSEEEIFKNFKKNTRYDIRKSIEEENIFSVVTDIHLFIKYYNIFAKQKQLSLLSLDSFDQKILSVIY